MGFCKNTWYADKAKTIPSVLYPQVLAASNNQEEVADNLMARIYGFQAAGKFTANQLLASGEPTLEAALQLAGPPSASQLHFQHLLAVEERTGKIRELAKARLRRAEKSQPGTTAVGKPGYKPRTKTLLEIRALNTALATAEGNEGFVAAVKYAVTDLRSKRQFLEEHYTPAKEKHEEALAEISGQMDFYETLNAPDLALKDSALRELLDDLNAEFRRTTELLVEKRLISRATFLANNSENPKYKGKLEASKEAVQEGLDEDKASAMLQTMASSKNPLLAVANKYHRVKEQEAHGLAEETIEKLEAAAADLFKKQGNEDTDWMHELDEHGKATGRQLRKTGAAYYEQRNAHWNALLDEHGERLEYHSGPAALLTPAQKAHNKNLAAKNQAYQAFTRKEAWNAETKQHEDGPNDRYTEDFKQKRAYFQEYRRAAAGEARQWLPNRATQQELGDKFQEQYEEFVHTHYSPPITFLTAEEEVDANGHKTGVLTGGTVELTVRPVLGEHSERGYAEKWHSEKWRKLSADTSALGKARMQFLQDWQALYASYLDVVPPQIRRKMVNQFPVMQAERASHLNTNPPGFVAQMKGLLTSGWDLEVFTKGRAVDESGRLEHDLPLLYVGGYRNEKAITTAKGRLDKLTDNRLSLIAEIGEEAYAAKLESAERKLSYEQNKLQGSQTETNPVKSLSAFIRMAQNYETLRSVETQFKLTQMALAERKYFQTNTAGEVLMQAGKPQYKESADVVSVQRLAAAMAQNLYKDDELAKSWVDQAIVKVIGYTSITAIAANPFSATKNFLAAKLQNWTEGLAGTFYNKKDFWHAGRRLDKSMLGRMPELLRNLASLSPQALPIKDDTDAAIHYYNFIIHGHDVQNQPIHGKLVDKAMLGIVGGEYMAQGQAGLAFLMARVLEDGEVLTREAFAKKHGLAEKSAEFKAAWAKCTTLADGIVNVNGKAKLREGFNLTTKQKHEITYQMRNMQKQVQGNNDADDKVAAKRFFLGRLALQYKNWVAPMVKARFGQKYFDEGTAMEMEGRYRAVYRMMKELVKTGKLMANYKNMSRMEQQNVQRTIYELSLALSAYCLYALIEGLKQGIPPDDEHLKACANFLQRTSEGVGGEMSTFVSPIQWYNTLKNPIPATKLLGNAGNLLTSIVQVPFYAATGDTDKLFYKTGVQKGNSKLWHNAKAVIPLLSLDGQLDQLAVNGTTFIK